MIKADRMHSSERGVVTLMAAAHRLYFKPGISRNPR
jgi:hypothetical protein